MNTMSRRLLRTLWPLLIPLALPALAAAPPAASPASAPAAVPAPIPPPADASASADAPANGAAAAATAGAAAADAAVSDTSADGAGGTRGLDEQIQDLKKDVVDLNKDLFVLEEELLFPANTQVAVFVSVDVGDFFALDSISLKIDNRDVSNYLYTPREVAALLKGGVQRLYVGNLKAGQHELLALFNGKGPHERDYRTAASLRFEKGVGAKYLELKITDHEHSQQPEFVIKDWD
ncbi:MAG TPA: hypothetical protein VIX87_07575 [Steroidobacteraceae bacterium]